MITNENFIEWENHVFGYGYGTGEQYTLIALKDIFNSLEEDDRTYNHQMLEKKLGHIAAWLMINILCHANIFEYGTSPRYGWITEKGELLRDFLKDKDTDELYNLTSVDSDFWGQDHGTNPLL